MSEEENLAKVDAGEDGDDGDNGPAPVSKYQQQRCDDWICHSSD